MKQLRILPTLSALYIFTGLLISCSQKLNYKTNSRQKNQINTNKVQILTTTNILNDLVTSLVPKDSAYAETDSLMSAGVDPHLYKATALDLLKVKKADIIILNGLYLEAKLEKTLKSLSATKKIITASDALSNEDLIKDANNTADPHIWFAPDLWIKAAGHIAEQLITKIPQHENEINENLQIWTNLVRKRSLEIKKDFDLIKPENKTLITSHDAFKYFGRYFGLKVKGIQGISTELEASLKDIQEIITLIKEKNIKSVFVENSISPATIKKVQNNSKAKIGGTLFGDSLSDKDGPASTYIKMIEHNSKTIIEGLK